MKNKDIRNSHKVDRTRELISKNGLSVFYRNVDFLTVKLPKLPVGVPTDSLSDSQRNLLTLYGIVPNSDTLFFDFGGFRLTYFETVSA